MSKIEPEVESWNTLTAVRGEEGGGDYLKEGEGISQRTYMHDSWTWTTVWGLTVGAGWAGWSVAQGENRDNCNSINNKIF